MANYKVRETVKFKKDLARLIRRGRDITLLESVVAMLATGSPLPERCRDHPLQGDWAGYRDCHVAPDWVLIYKIERNILFLTLTRTGSHTDLGIE